MSAEITPNERELHARLEETRQRLARLAAELRSAENELSSLADERARHRLLREACVALERLAETGGSALFWGEHSAESASALRLARGRLDAFEKQLAELEDRRQALLDETALEEQRFDLAEDDVLELERERAERELEWRIEREESALPPRTILMPWSKGGPGERRFRRALASAVFASAAFAVVVPQIPLPLHERKPSMETPQRLARLLEEMRPLPPPQPPRPAQRSEPERVEAQRAQTRRVAERSAPTPGPQPGPGVGTGTGEGAASGPKGILAFREQLSGLARAAPGARLGLAARIGSAAEGPSGPPERSLLTSMASGSNAGVNLAAISRAGGGGGGGHQLEGVAVMRATSTIGGGGGGGGGGGRGAGGAQQTLGRTDEEIQIVFDRHKAELYRLYNRELREAPTLEGQMVLRMKIEPDGSVSLCALHATDMDAPQLAAQVVDRVRGFDFGAKEGISAVTILYPIHFLPAT